MAKTGRLARGASRFMRVLDGETRVSHGWGLLTLGAPGALALYLFQLVESQGSTPHHYVWAWPAIGACVVLALFGLVLLFAHPIRGLGEHRFATGSRVSASRSLGAYTATASSSVGKRLPDGSVRKDAHSALRPRPSTGNLPVVVDMKGLAGHRDGDAWVWSAEDVAFASECADPIRFRIGLVASVPTEFVNVRELPRVPDQIVSLAPFGDVQVSLEFHMSIGRFSDAGRLAPGTTKELHLIEIGSKERRLVLPFGIEPMPKLSRRQRKRLAKQLFKQRDEQGEQAFRVQADPVPWDRVRRPEEEADAEVEAYGHSLGDGSGRGDGGTGPIELAPMSPPVVPMNKPPSFAAEFRRFERLDRDYDGSDEGKDAIDNLIQDVVAKLEGWNPRQARRMEAGRIDEFLYPVNLAIIGRSDVTEDEDLKRLHLVFKRLREILGE